MRLAPWSHDQTTIPTITVKEPGYLYTYLTYESQSAVGNSIYFDDFSIVYTPTNVLQYNEYYPFGLQTQNSWTRAGVGNNFLYNDASELNSATKMYDLPFRNYDAALGRFFQVDALALRDHEFSPFVYGGNNPIIFNDPTGLSKERDWWAWVATALKFNGGTWSADGSSHLFSPEEDAVLAEFIATGSVSLGATGLTVVNNGNGTSTGLSYERTGSTFLLIIGIGQTLSGKNVGKGNNQIAFSFDFPQGPVEAPIDPQTRQQDPFASTASFGSEASQEASQADPSYAHAGEFGGTLAEFSMSYRGWTLEQVQNEMNAKGKFNSQPGGPGKIRYVEDPLNKGKYIDMRHMLVVGYKWGQGAGLGIEIWQLIAFPASAMNKQDFYSNELGDHFEQMFPSYLSGSTSFVDQLNTFLNSKYYRGDFSRVVK